MFDYTPRDENLIAVRDKEFTLVEQVFQKTLVKVGTEKNTHMFAYSPVVLLEVALMDAEFDWYVICEQRFFFPRVIELHHSSDPEFFVLRAWGPLAFFVDPTTWTTLSANDETGLWCNSDGFLGRPEEVPKFAVEPPGSQRAAWCSPPVLKVYKITHY